MTLPVNSVEPAGAKPESGKSPSSHSQTLSRGLQALEVLSEAGRPITIAELAQALGVHRSVAYRLLRTLEDHALVRRDSAGRIRLGPKMAQLARGVEPNLQAVALPELTELANRHGVTAFIGLLDDDDVVTLISAEPRIATASIAQRPGSRHSLFRGAAGLAIRMQMSPAELNELRERGYEPDEEAIRTAIARGYALSHNEAVAGLSAYAVPLRRLHEQLASIGAVFLSSGPEPDEAAIAASLREAAHNIAQALG